MRAAQICSAPGCPNLKPCPIHQVKPWTGSKRKQRRTLSGSREQRRARFVLTRFETVCHVCGKHGADQVDHVIPLAEGGADDLSNLRPIHASPCHRDKTAREAQAGRERNRIEGAE